MNRHVFIKKSMVAAVDNEQGTAIVAALLILLLLTFVAIMATDTTTTEKAIVRSDSVFERNFYRAESAALEGIQKLANESSPQELLAPLITTDANNANLLRAADSQDPDNDVANLDISGDSEVDKNDFLETSQIDSDNSTYRAVVQKPIQSGNSLGMESSRLYDYVAYGYSEGNRGRAMVKIGFKKRF